MSVVAVLMILTLASSWMLVKGRQMIKMSDKVQCETAHLRRRRRAGQKKQYTWQCQGKCYSMYYNYKCRGSTSSLPVIHVYLKLH